MATTDFWYSDECPASNAGSGDVANRPIILQPPKNGSLFRVVELPPDSERTFSNLKAVDADGDALEKGKRHPAFHKTKTLDYIFVLEGEIYCMLDEGEVFLREGDVLIQRGTSHAWSNRSKTRCLLLATMLDAKPL
jgi:mannose-6-phosphate isomerase-like protein (cupin superfamily)